MSPQPNEADDIAREQIAWWQAHGIEPLAAWISLGQPYRWSMLWWEVRHFLVNWLLSHPVDVDSADACHIMPIERGPAVES
jgi:hypothetical protein